MNVGKIFVKRNESGSVQYTTPEINDEKHIIDNIDIYLAILTIFLNILVMLVYATMKKILKEKTPNFMLLNQAIVDLVIGFLHLMYPLPSFFQVPDDYYVYVNIAEKCTMYLALGMLLFSSVERYIAIRYPLKHRVKVTRKMLVLVTMAIWSLSCIPVLTQIVYYYWDASRDFRRVIFSIENIFILFGIIILHVVLWQTYQEIQISIEYKLSSIKKMSYCSTDSRSSVSCTESTLKRHENKLFKIFALMAISYVVTYIPLLVCNIVLDVSTKNIDDVVKYSLIQVTTSLYTSSALFNPVITLLLKKDFRHFFKRVGNFNKSIEGKTSSTRTSCK